MLSDLRFRLRALFDRRALERELDDELRFHLEQETEKLVRSGLSRHEAERRARLAFGGLDRIKDDARDARGVMLLDALRQDVRYALRGLRARPGFALAVVATLALGIGANTAMFGVVDRLLLRAPAYMMHADHVHRVYMPYRWNGEDRLEGDFSYLRYEELQRLTTSFEAFAAWSERDVAIGTGVDAHEMRIAAVSASMFDFFDARPVLGRFFTASEDAPPAGAPVAVLSYGMWMTEFGGRRDVLGKELRVDTEVLTVIGVAPRDFIGVTDGPAPALFVPVTTIAAARNETFHRTHNWSWLQVIARRKPGVSVDAASADLGAAFVRSWNDELAASSGGWPAAEAAGVRGVAAPVQAWRGPDAGIEAQIVVWVMGVAFIVLLVACANVANLLLARAAVRRREIALRQALGVSRRRLLQQLLTETLVLAVLGATAGLLVARIGGDVLQRLFLADGARAAGLGDTRTLAFVTLLTLGVALLTGLAPAVHVLRDVAGGTLKAGMRDSVYRSSRLRTALLVFQGALSVVLLIGAGLFVRSLGNVRALRLGYDVAPIVLAGTNLRGAELSPAETQALGERLVAAAAALPGAMSATTILSIPFWSYSGRGIPQVEGVDSLRGRFIVQPASPTYFETIGTRILRGRGIAPTDRAGSTPVVVVSASMARAIWGSDDPLGKRMHVGPDSLPDLTVVGVAEDMRARSVTGAPDHWYYLAADQQRALFGDQPTTVMVRFAGDARDHAETVRRRLQQEMPGDAYVQAVPFADIVEPQHRSWQFGATMFAAFGALALVLAAVGLYSVIAYAVTQRRHEIGIRVALGAEPRDVVRMVVGQGVAFAALGVVIGSALALFAGRWIEPLLYAQSPYDARIIGSVGALMLGVAVLATLQPTWRAAHVDPTRTLREE